MQPIHLPDHVYQQAQQRAVESGFSSVDDYIADIVENQLASAANLDDRFTPAVVTELGRLHAEVQAGAKTYSANDVDDHFRRKSRAWHAAPDE